MSKFRLENGNDSYYNSSANIRGPNPKRPFLLFNEKLVLDVDLYSRKIEGTATLLFQSFQKRLYEAREIKFNSRQCRIKYVILDGIAAKFEIKNYLERIVPDNDYEVSIENYNSIYKASQIASDEGELIIYLPEQFRQQGMKDEDPEQHRLTIHYELVDPKGVVYFLLPDINHFPNRSPQMFIHNQTNGARCWFPCLDSLTDRCTYNIEVTVDASFVVVCSGELTQQILSEDETKKTFIYDLPLPTIAQSISMAIAPFEIHPSKHSTTSFCLPGRLKELQHTTAFISQAIEFFEEYMGSSFPYSSYKQVFIEEAYSKVNSAASLSIFSTHLLLTDKIIDQTYKTRRLLALGIAMQWFGNIICSRTWSDLWIIYGLAGYLSDLFFRKMFGNNEYKLRIVKDTEWVCANEGDQTLMPEYTHPTEIFSSKFFRKKSALVMYMIERRVGPNALRNVIANMVHPQAPQGNDPAPPLERSVSTKRFLKILRKFTGHDLKAFADRWVFGKGCPNLSCGFFFNKKKHVLEFAVKQNKSPAGRIIGSLTVRVNELEGAYDHIAAFDDDLLMYEFPCHSRVRKPRRGKKKADGKEELEDDAEPPVPGAPGSDLAKKLLDAPILWVRLDPDMEYIHNITFKQPQYMWIHQLEQDVDVIAQYEAVRALAQFPNSPKALESLMKVLETQQIFYRIRIEAAHSLTKLQGPGVDALLKYFKAQYFDPEKKQIKQNDFSDFVRYFLQKGIIEALSSVRGMDGNTPTEILELLVGIVKNSDNSMNYYSDNNFLACVISSLSNIQTNDNRFLAKLKKMLLKFLKFEKLVPSFQNAVAIASLETLNQLMVSRKIPSDAELFKELSKYGNYEELRVVAIRGLVRLGVNIHANLRFLMDVYEKDPNPITRSKLLDALCNTPHGQDSSAYIRMLSSDHPENVAMAVRLWNLLNSLDTAYDGRVRTAMRSVFRKWYGKGVPPLLGNKERIKKLLGRDPRIKEARDQERESKKKEKEKSKEREKLPIKRKAEEPVTTPPDSKSQKVTVVPPAPKPVVITTPPAPPVVAKAPEPPAPTPVTETPKLQSSGDFKIRIKRPNLPPQSPISAPATPSSEVPPLTPTTPAPQAPSSNPPTPTTPRANEFKLSVKLKLPVTPAPSTPITMAPVSLPVPALAREAPPNHPEIKVEPKTEVKTEEKGEESKPVLKKVRIKISDDKGKEGTTIFSKQLNM